MHRVAIVGIDGSGKTTTAVRLVERLCRSLRVCQPGRPALLGRDGSVESLWPELCATLERALRRADETGRKRDVVFSRRRYLRAVAQMERRMARELCPDVMLVARCPIVDPAVYADFYLPRAARLLGLGARLRLSSCLSRLPPRELYFLLDTPVALAMERIRRRVADEGREAGREHWLHLHERPDVLARLAALMAEALERVSRRTGARVVRIDNSMLRQDGVVELMADRILCLGSRRRASARVPTTVTSFALPEDEGEVELPGVEGVEVALLAAGSRRFVALVAGAAEGLRCFVCDLEARTLTGPYTVDPEEATSVSSLGTGPTGDAWAVYTARTKAGTEVRVARVAGRDGHEAWGHPSRPGLLSTAPLVPGACAAGAWDGAGRALVAYVEPSRTALWGLLVNGEGRVVVPPFCVATAEEGELLGDGTEDVALAVGREAGGWRATYTTSAARTRRTVVDEGGHAIGPPEPAERPTPRAARAGSLELGVSRPAAEATCGRLVLRLRRAAGRPVDRDTASGDACDPSPGESAG